MTNNALTVLITDYAYDDVSIETDILTPLGYQLTALKAGKDQALFDAVRDADAVITQFAAIDASVIGAMRKCRVIVRYGIGVDNVDLAAAADKGIPVCNVPDYCIDEVADHTLALMLCATRQIVPCNNVIKSGTWKLPVPLTSLKALKYLTVGLVGFGRIGREVAARLQPFKCRILVYDPACSADAVREAHCVPATLDAVLSESDLLSLHCPSTEQTRYLLNAASIETMKPGAILVNASRGTLVQTEALIMALKSGQLSAAAMDVTDPEPINADNELLTFDSVVITPHVASATLQSMVKLRTDAAGLAVLALRGDKLLNIVNGVR